MRIGTTLRRRLRKRFLCCPVSCASNPPVVAANLPVVMNANPINLAVRFLLELAMLFVLSWWGWRFHGIVTAIGLPVAAAVMWGVFRIPNDPKAAPVAVPGVVRLALEWGLFGFAVWA